MDEYSYLNLNFVVCSLYAMNLIVVVHAKHACYCMFLTFGWLVGCSGDPTMYEEFWRGTGDSASIFIPGWQTMSYFSDLGGICWFLEPGFEREVRRLHRLVGNAVVDGYHVLVGTGSTQLFQAVLYALSPATDGTPMNVVSPAPYYSVRIDRCSGINQ